MWELRRLTILSASTACYNNSFTHCSKSTSYMWIAVNCIMPMYTWTCRQMLPIAGKQYYVWGWHWITSYRCIHGLIDNCYLLLESNTPYEDGSELHHTNIHMSLQATVTDYYEWTSCIRMPVITSHRYTHGLHSELLPIAGKQSVTSPMQSLLSAKRCSIGGVGEKPPHSTPCLAWPRCTLTGSTLQLDRCRT